MQTPSPGARLGRYELVQPIGRGGMGEVWEAVLVGPDAFRKPVALKLLPLAAEDADARAALAREARLGALLNHPNVVAIHDLAVVDGRHLMAMELVRGASVHELLRWGPLPCSAVLDLGIQAATGLGHVHGLRIAGRPGGLVHRDVKPSNLLVDRNGVVKVADLGVARLAAERGGFAGTHGFSAPEQYFGTEDGRADLFALGVTLFVAATGNRPFGRGFQAVAAVNRVERELASPSFLAALDAAASGLAEVVRRCLRADPADRWSDASSLVAALSALRPRHAGPSAREVLDSRAPEGAFGDRDPTPATGEQTVVVRRGNAPAPRDRFFGRSAELADLVRQVGAGERLLTLLGPGGMGKTRLAIECAHVLERRLAGGAWFFDLSEAHTSEEACFAIAKALAIELDRTDPVAQIGHAMAARGPALFVLDNLEQIADRVPIGQWHARAPEATLLCTSRRSLRLGAERQIDVGPLPLDDAVALFRARAHGRIDPGETRSLVEALDGMPLAIELAAARSRILSVSEIRRRLTDRLRLLAVDETDRPERHRSLRASLDGSWDLLDAASQRATAELSVFQGGFTLAAAEAVLSPDPEAWAIDRLQGLADASLVRYDRDADRFTMLLAVQAYAAERLADPRPVGARHAAFHAQLGTPEALALLRIRGGDERIRRLQAEQENLVAACRFAIAVADVPVAVGAALAASQNFELRGPHAVGAELLRTVLALPGIGPRDRVRLELASAHAALDAGQLGPSRASFERALAIVGDPELTAHAEAGLGALEAVEGAVASGLVRIERALGMQRAQGTPAGEAQAMGALAEVLHRTGRMEEARAGFVEAVRQVRALGDHRSEARLLGELARLDLDQGRMDDARRGYEVALELVRRTGNRRLEGVISASLGTLYHQQSRWVEARNHYEGAIAVHREVGNRRNEGGELSNLALIHQEEGRVDEARRQSEEALAIHRELGNRRFEAITLANLGLLANHVGDRREARARWEEALAIHRDVANPRSEGIVLAALARLAFDEGRRDDAEAAWSGGIALLRQVDHKRILAMALADRAVMHAHDGHGDDARGLIAEAHALLDAIGDLRLLGATHARGAEVERILGDTAAAIRGLEASEATLREAGARAELAHTLVARAEVEPGSTRRAGWLLEAEALAVTTGMGPGSEVLTRIRSLR